jgi:hypothetical protein
LNSNRAFRKEKKKIVLNSEFSYILQTGIAQNPPPPPLPAKYFARINLPYPRRRLTEIVKWDFMENSIQTELLLYLHLFSVLISSILFTKPSIGYSFMYVFRPERIEWFIEVQAFLMPYNSAPRPPFPLSANCLSSRSQSFCVLPDQLTDWREGGGGGRGAESYDRKKAWASINCSILSDLDNVFFLLLRPIFRTLFTHQIIRSSTGLLFLHILMRKENKLSL